MQVRLNGKQNIYLEIAEEYKRYIRMGILKQDEKLPSCRSLALELGINPNTVERAYSVLEAEGYITTLPKKGVFVKNREFAEEELQKGAQMQVEQFKAAGIGYSDMTQIVERVYKERGKSDRD